MEKTKVDNTVAAVKAKEVKKTTISPKGKIKEYLGKKEVKKEEKEKVRFGRLGSKCPVCKAKGAIVSSNKKPHVSFGDGMAGMSHVDIDIEPPLRCRLCGAHFKAKKESVFVVVLSRIFK